MPKGILYPTGGGVGLLGMWKAFEEMEQLGWIGPERPRMVCVQASGCAPVVKAWNEKQSVSQMWANASTAASGLRVPKPYGDYLILEILRNSGGIALSVPDDEIMQAVRHWGKMEGIFAAPEGAAVLAGYKKLLASEFFSPDDAVVLFNTGTGYKYLDVMESSRPLQPKQGPASRAIGGIIGPY